MRRRYIGSDMTRASAKQAAVAISGKEKLITTNGGRHTGSNAGMKGGPTARLQHRDGGYFNPALHDARRKANHKTPILDYIRRAPQMVESNPVSGRMIDRRVSKFSNGAAAIIKSRIR